MSKELPANYEGSQNPNRELTKFYDEWERQVGLSLKLGFHGQLGMSVDEYLSTIPEFKIEENEQIDPNAKLVLVEPRIPARIKLHLAGYNYFIKDIVHDGVKTPELHPYSVLLTDNYNYDNSKPTSSKHLATLHEGVGLLIYHPTIVNKNPIALPGSYIRSSQNTNSQMLIPCINQWSDGKLGIGADLIGCLNDEGAKPIFSSTLRG